MCKCQNEDTELKMWCIDQIIRTIGTDPVHYKSSDQIIIEANKLFDYIIGGGEKEKQVLND